MIVKKQTKEKHGLVVEQTWDSRRETALNIRYILFESRDNDNNTILQHTVWALHLITFKQHKWGVKPERNFHTRGHKNKSYMELSVNIFNQTIAA